jgi:AMP phosphorylase
MKLKVKILGLESGGKPIVILNSNDAEELGIRSGGRIKIHGKRKTITALVNVTTRIIPKNFIGIYEEIRKVMKLKDGEEIEIEVSKFPDSLQAIKNKLKGRNLSRKEMFEIVKDVVEGNLTEIEIASFVVALHNFGLSMDEVISLSLAMVESGEKLELKNRKPIVDKHSIGGMPGDKTTLLLVPIIASAGLTIPKTSSRAITSAGGTADRASVLMNVELDVNEMKKVVEKTNGCIVWGGSLHLAPADDIFIQVEYPLSIDPLLLPSIMSKKKAVGANFLVIDIPTGRGTKVKTIGDANLLAKDFIELGKRLGITTQCAVTYGEEPLGYAIGPALEAREALEVLMRRKNIFDVIDKAVDLASVILKMTNKGNRKTALDLLKSGKAEQKLREIISWQDGDMSIMPEDIEIGNYGFDMKSDRNGFVLWVDNNALVSIARAAGAPKDKGAGILLHRKVGDRVKKGETIFTVYAEKRRKLKRVRKVLEEEQCFGIGERREILIHVVKEEPLHKKAFILDR